MMYLYSKVNLTLRAPSSPCFAYSPESIYAITHMHALYELTLIFMGEERISLYKPFPYYVCAVQQ